MKNPLRRKRWLAPTLVLLLLSLPGLVSCGSPALGSSPPPNVQIGWVNFVRFGGITYVAAATTAGRALTANDLGPVFATVTFKLADTVHDPHYQTKDGDAAFLAAGTRLYMVKGYKPTFRLAAQEGQAVTLYQVDTNSHASQGGDLLDIAGKVISLGILSAQDGVTELSAIKKMQQVTALVAMVLQAPIDPKHQAGDSQYFIAFHLADGTALTEVYWLDTNAMGRGILLPAAFRLAIKAVLPASQ